ncbi:hypothetical protein K492DRAFT_190420 [Lichtheimia hyalospora FSU 10163]|nr:hypothetical protein K492DRAFT_190420 [Lichtheimia hyalospora FSU 10163]
MSETSKKNTHHSTKHEKHHHTSSSHHHHHTPAVAIKPTPSINSHSPFIQFINPAHDAIPVSRHVPFTSMPFTTSATSTAASITPSVPIITDSSNGKHANDNLVGTMLGTLGGFTVLLMAIIIFTSVKRSRRRARQNINQQGRGGVVGKRGWGIRDSWYSDTLSTCPSTLPPPYDVGYDDHDKKEQPTSGVSGKDQQLLQPPSPTAVCTTNKTLQYAPQLAYSPTSYSAFDMTKHDIEKQQQQQQPMPPNSAVTSSNVRNSLQYAPQLAFSPSFHTSNLISGIDMSQETLPPVPFISRSTPSNERGGDNKMDIQGQPSPPSPTATQSTPHYSPQLAFSSDQVKVNQESITATTHHVVKQTSSLDTRITVDQNEERHLLLKQCLPEQPPATTASSSRRTSAAAAAAATPSPIVVPRPSRSTVRSYHAQLNMDL